jgi:hypothetical protein
MFAGEVLMSLDTKQRDEIDEGDFAGPNRTYPVDTQEHAKAAWDLAGKAANPDEVRAKIKRIAKRKGFTLPETAREFAEMVNRKGRVFKFGDHVDGKGQKFSLTRSEFDAANPPGTVVPIGFDPRGKAHYDDDNAFDGKLGSTKLSSTTTHVMGDYSLHPLLAEIVKERDLKASAIFGVPDKKVKRIDITDRPVSTTDAVFFAEDGTDEVAVLIDAEFATLGVDGMGATAIDTNANSALRETENADGIRSPMVLALQAGMQHIHDACCSAYPSICVPQAAFAASEGIKKHVKMIHDMTVVHRAKCSGKAKFAQGATPVDETELAQMKAELAQMKAEREQDKAALKNERDRRIATEADQFASENAKVLPYAAQVKFAYLYRQLAESASSLGTVEFAYGPENKQEFKGSTLDLLKEAVGGLRPHGIGLELAHGGSADAPLEAPRKTPNGLVLFAGSDEPAPNGNKVTPDGKPIPKAREDYLKSFISGAKGPEYAVFAAEGSGQLSSRAN